MLSIELGATSKHVRRLRYANLPYERETYCQTTVQYSKMFMPSCAKLSDTRPW
jgi:hypothetical protein